MSINTEYFEKCLNTLQQALKKLEAAPVDSIEYDIYRCAVIKSFELNLEITGKLLRRLLKNYEGNPKAIDALTYKDVLRHSGKHSILSQAQIERWFKYRDNRNHTAHDYGQSFAEDTLSLLPNFIKDANSIISFVKQYHGD